MEELINFFIEIGKLKKMKRMGWVINRVKEPEDIADHVFRMAIMAWFFAEKKGGLKIEKILKMALIHDLCEIYAGDTTPYDSILPKDKRKWKKLMKTWPRFSGKEKIELAFEKHKKEWSFLLKLTAKLSPKLRKEVLDLWVDYEEGLTKEGRFLHQADRMENLLQALEYWKKQKTPPIRPWWIWAKEFFDDPLLLDFMRELDKKFHSGKPKKEIKRKKKRNG